MFRILTRQLYFAQGPLCRRAACPAVTTKASLVLAVCPNYRAHSSAARLQPPPAVEETSLSLRILQHFRERQGYCETQDVCTTNVMNNAGGINQMLLIISHSPGVLPSDVLKLFSLYKTSGHSVLTDIFGDRQLMNNVRKKVELCLPSMTVVELRSLALLLKHLNTNKIKFLCSLTNSVMQECQKRATEVELAQALELFDIILLLFNTNAYKKTQYDTFMSLFEPHIKKATQDQLVQVLHYVGIGKNKKLSKEFVDKIIKQLNSHCEDLSFTDAGIVAAAIFKSNVRLNDQSPLVHTVVHLIQTRIGEGAPLNALESYGFVAMTKLLRAAKHRNAHLLQSISTYIMETEDTALPPQVIAHILALYANSSHYCAEVFTKLEDLTLHQYLTSTSSAIRIKDVARITWSFSHTNHKCSPQFQKLVETCVMESLGAAETDHYPEFLASTLLSLAIMGQYPSQLIQAAFVPHRLQQLQGYQRSKHLSRLLTVLQGLRTERPDIAVEDPNICHTSLPVRTLDEERKYRPALATLAAGAQVINSCVGGAPVFKLRFPVPHINYASLVLDGQNLLHVETLQMEASAYEPMVKKVNELVEALRDKHIVIELLDSSTTLHNTSEVIGIIGMKLRILETKGWVVIRVREEDVVRHTRDPEAVAALLLSAVAEGAL